MKNLFLCFIFFVAIYGNFTLYLTLENFIRTETNLIKPLQKEYIKVIYNSKTHTHMYLPAAIRKGVKFKTLEELLQDIEEELNL